MHGEPMFGLLPASWTPG